MGLFADLTNGIAVAFGNGVVERLSRESGLKIAQRDGDKYTLAFAGDSIMPTRDLNIVKVPDEELLSFYTVCRAVLPARRLPERVMPALLVRNRQIYIGGWYAMIDDEGDALFILRYGTHSECVTAKFFRHICLSMVKEVAEIEADFAKSG